MMARTSWASMPATGSRRGGLHWLWLGLFIASLTFLGGSSWSDPIHHLLLRPVAALLLIPAMYEVRREDVRRGRIGLILLGSLLFWIMLQLVPLPPSVWQMLPDRQLIAEMDKLSGLESVWRPVSLAPFRGINAAFGMVVPLAALVLALATRNRSRWLLIGILAMGLLDAVLALLQVIGGTDSPFYLFPNPSTGAAEGIFANENHSAVFSAIVMLIITRLALDAEGENDPRGLRLSYVPAFLLILLAVLVSGSRAGIAAALLALGSSAMMIWWTMPRRDRAGAQSSGRLIWRTGRRAALVGCAAATTLLIAAFVWLERTPAFADIMRSDSFDDLRWSLWPILTEMAATHWMLGTGFGSFDAVYRYYEPTTLLLPLYVNQAHNDWAQLIIEGGLPAATMLICFLAWLAKSVLSLGHAQKAMAGQIIFWITCTAIIGAASIVDYPLRTPIFQAVCVWLLICLRADNAEKNGA